jgi:DNA-binding SARP family transcriptional activator/streptogramin lyase
VKQTSRPRFRLLGQVEIAGGNTLGGPKQRTLLAYLLLHAGELVPTERLVDTVWAERPPPTAIAIVHAYVRKLRSALADTPATLLTRAPGYVLQLDANELDVREFERLTAAGRKALRAGEPDTARATLSDGLELWRGEPFADLPAEGFVADERNRLEQLHSEAVSDRIEADLALGGAGELIAELEALVREQPFQERPRRQLMIALYRSGRQANALALYRETRRLLVDELGLEPVKALQELEQAMLRQDAALDLPAQEARATAGPPAPRVRRRRFLAAAAAVPVIAAAIALPLALSKSSRGPAKPHPARILATLDLPQPSCCGFGFDALWGVGHHDDILRKIDPRTSRVLDQWHVAGYQSGPPLAAAGSVWVPSAAEGLVRFDPTRGSVVARVPVQGSKIAFAYLDVWETTRSHQLDRIDLHTNKIIKSIRLAPGANNWDDELAIGEGAVWVAVADNATLVRIDQQTNRIVGSITGFGTTDSGMPFAVDRNAVWVLRMVGGQETLFRVDPGTNTIVKRIQIGPPNGTSPTGTVATGGGYVWTGNWNRSVSKVDPRTNRVVATYTLPDNPQNVTFGDGSLWVDSYDASKAWRIDPNA